VNSIEKIAKLAANIAYPLLKQADFGESLFEWGKGQTAPGQFQKQLEEFNLPKNQTFMSTMAQSAMPLFEAAGGVGGIPAIAGLLDAFRGGGNIGMLLRGKDNSSPFAMLRSSTAADPDAVFDPQQLQKALRPNVNLTPPAAPGVVQPPLPPAPVQQQPQPQPNVPAPGPVTTMNQTPPSGYTHHGRGRYTAPNGTTGWINPKPGGPGPSPLGKQILAQPSVPKPSTSQSAMPKI